ncbi:hypothetical protein [Sphingobacterium sp. LRF_L2]|uniref:hypothetical protein n=1 Tax=Sphingobacterium sp. LRF_L2 TaxID=3369421 RepID=UPI003F5D9E99
MKKSMYLFLFVICMFSAACSKSESSEPADTNPLVGTKWQTDDLSANTIYGGVNFQVIHFKSNTEFEVLNVRNGAIRKLMYEGVYTVSNATDVNMKYSVDGSPREWNLEITDSRTMKRKPEATAYNVYIKQ